MCYCWSYLGEPLLEVVEKHVGLVREDSKRSVITHAEGGLLSYAQSKRVIRHRDVDCN